MPLAGRIVVATSLLVAWSSPAEAAGRFVVVPPFEVENAKDDVTDKARLELEELVRAEVSRGLAPAGFRVLDRAETARRMTAKGVLPASCGNRLCHAEAAKAIGADLFVSGVVERKGDLSLFVRIMETGTLLTRTAVVVRAQTPMELAKAFKAESAAWLWRSELLSTPPRWAPKTGTADMVRIPGGTFLMGSADGDEEERPVHKVTLSPYFIDRTEVTVADYAACVKARECGAPEPSKSTNWNVPGREQHPVNDVSWEDARMYCLSRWKRLPTEAEWEFAARGTDGRQFPWGKAAPARQLCWGGGDGDAGTFDLERSVRDVLAPAKRQRQSSCPVGSHPADGHASGLRDLAGNVAEWVFDWQGAYPAVSQRDPTGPAWAEYRVIRGGSWYYIDPALLRATRRSGMVPWQRSGHVGFRCARGAGR